MPTMKTSIGGLLGMTGAAAGALYVAVLAFVSPSDSSVFRYGSAAVIAVASVVALQAVMVRQTRPAKAVVVNAAVWTVFSAVLTLDGVFIHPGLAKDLEPTATAMVLHFLRLLLVMAIPATGLSTALYFGISRWRRCGAGVRI